MSDGGKGSTQRPLKIPKEKFDSNWETIFKKKLDKEVKEFLDSREEFNDK